MLSYRHAFHAGNHADVLKHLALYESLRYLAGKPAPLRYVDTHAGPGLVELGSGHAERTGEWKDGVGLVAAAARDGEIPAPVGRYLELVRSFNPDGFIGRYPGSPLVAAAALRPVDRGFLYELHPSDEPELRAAFEGDRRFRVARADGLAALRGLVPPPDRRAFVLIDPPYERAEEYDLVLDAVADALARFPNGAYAIWYPLLAKPEARNHPDRIGDLHDGNRARIELKVSAEPTDGWGMYGSGLVVLNPPFGLKAAMEACLPFLARILGRDGAGEWRMDWTD